jgi:hypothetical protein
MSWQRISSMGNQYLSHPAGFTISRVPAGDSVRYELYGNGRYYGWWHTADGAKAEFERLTKRDL